MTAEHSTIIREPTQKHTQSLPACMQVRFGPTLSYDRAKKWKILHKKGLLAVLKRIMMVRDTTPSKNTYSCQCCHKRVWSEFLQFNWFRAAMRLYNASTQSKSSTARKILQADMHLGSQCHECWSSQILSAINGLTQSYMFRGRQLKCEL